MSEPETTSTSPAQRKLVWVGRVISGLVAALFAMSGVMKLMDGHELADGIGHLGLPESMVLPLAILELTSLVIYLVPATSVADAILLTGYIGGAICTHWRVGDPFVANIAIGVFISLGLYLREARLRAILPLRTSS